MMRLDGRTEEQIAVLVAWSQHHPFWLKNILSMGKLRQQFDRLTLEMKSPKGMQMETLQQAARGPNATARHSKPSGDTMLSDSQKHREQIAEMVTATVEVMGTELSPPALALFVTDLEKLPIESVAGALARCRREIHGRNGFPPMLTIADVLGRAGVVAESETEDAEWQVAWDVAVHHASKYIITNPEGEYEEKHYFGETIVIPELSQRIRDTVRRIGGWRAIKCMSNDDFPFVQKRFREAYQACEAAEVALSRNALAGIGGFKELMASKTMPEGKRLADVRAESRLLSGRGNR